VPYFPPIESGPGGATAWGAITGTLTDQADLTTALGDKTDVGHSHQAADLASGTLDIARIPTGTTGTTVALGNHTHANDHVRAHSITSASDHSFPGGTTTFLRADGTFATPTAAASLTSSQAFATATTTISTATYADITGCSLSLAAGTWLVMGQVNIMAANAIVQAFVAITDGANAVVSEVAASRPASGTASLNSPFSCNPIAIVSPVGTTTYKLRGARGLTTHTGSWIAVDGNGVNTLNHASNNTDKGTGIFAVKIA
jgi:hypothetical protein